MHRFNEINIRLDILLVLILGIHSFFSMVSLSIKCH